jgi:hypothetical protein
MFNGNSFRDQKQLKVLKKYNSASDLRKSNKKKLLRDYLSNRATDRRNDWLADIPQNERISKLLYFKPSYFQTKLYKHIIFSLLYRILS